LKHTNDINTPDQDGITALHLASMISPYLVEKLLAAGADPTQTTRDGMNVLHLAARARQSDIVGMLTVALTI
jgi:ankyrin repeat protein